MFQPIVSAAINAAAPKKSSSELPKDVAKGPPTASKEVTQDSVTVQKERHVDLVKPKLTRLKQRKFVLNDGLGASGHESRPESEGTLHLRSRSNEMEYISASSGDIVSSAFRSPPSSAQVFRPLSFSFQLPAASAKRDSERRSNLQGGADDRSSLNTELENCSLDSQQSQKKDASSLNTTLAKARNTDGNEDDLADGFEEPKSEKRSSWLKDFNETLWSNYFASPDQTS